MAAFLKWWKEGKRYSSFMHMPVTTPAENVVRIPMELVATFK